MTSGEKYHPAMAICKQQEADAYFEHLVSLSIADGYTREEAERIERCNLAYFARYYDRDTLARVEALFHCTHPPFTEAIRIPTNLG